ncbi:MAG: hypothetical protein H7145_01165 [Akkermansiaceae bacterium]|nr:hypothetical protein [Armatimonadota bacterium]
MAKLSRSAFLYSLGATSVFILTGCGSGTDKNSSFGGAYRAAYTIPQLGESGIFTFTVGTKGDVTGSLDNQSGKLREFSGKLENNGVLNGSTFDRTANTRGTFSGTVAGTGLGGLPEVSVSVTGGNFTLTEGNVPYSGSFNVGETPVAPGTSGYQGSYSGVYNVPGLSQNGSTSFSVDSSGAMTGLFTRGNETGSLTGTINSAGNFTADVDFGNETVGLAGVLTKTTDNSTQGNFTLTQGNQSFVGSLGKSDIAPTAGNSPYAGSYRGTYGIPEQSENGNISLTVDPSGSFTGFLSQTNNSPVGTFVGAFNNDGRFNGSVTYEPASGLSERKIEGRLGTSTLEGGGQAGDFIISIDGVGRAGNFELSVGGSEPNSGYRGSYSDGGFFGDAFTPRLPEDIAFASASVEFSIDKEGSILGTFGPYPIAGRVSQDGRVVGTIRTENSRVIAFRGIMNKLTWTFNEITSVNGETTEKTRPGIKGDFVFTVDGRDYSGYLKVTGGDGVTRKRN